MYIDPENGFVPDEIDKGECLICKFEDDLDNFKTFAGRTVCDTCIKWAIEDGESITEMVVQEVEYRKKLKALATLEFSKLIKSINFKLKSYDKSKPSNISRNIRRCGNNNKEYRFGGDS